MKSNRGRPPPQARDPTSQTQPHYSGRMFKAVIDGAASGAERTQDEFGAWTGPVEERRGPSLTAREPTPTSPDLSSCAVIPSMGEYGADSRSDRCPRRDHVRTLHGLGRENRRSERIARRGRLEPLKAAGRALPLPIGQRQSFPRRRGGYPTSSRHPRRQRESGQPPR